MRKPQMKPEKSEENFWQEKNSPEKWGKKKVSKKRKIQEKMQKKKSKKLAGFLFWILILLHFTYF